MKFLAKSKTDEILKKLSENQRKFPDSLDLLERLSVHCRIESLIYKLEDIRTRINNNLKYINNFKTDQDLEEEYIRRLSHFSNIITDDFNTGIDISNQIETEFKEIESTL